MKFKKYGYLFTYFFEISAVIVFAIVCVIRYVQVTKGGVFGLKETMLFLFFGAIYMTVCISCIFDNVKSNANSHRNDLIILDDEGIKIQRVKGEDEQILWEDVASIVEFWGDFDEIRLFVKDIHGKEIWWYIQYINKKSKRYIFEHHPELKEKFTLIKQK